MSQTPRNLALAAAGALTLIAAGCSTGPFATQGRFFQYHTPDNRVVAEYLTADTATCQQHLANLQRTNVHGSEAARCSASSAAASLPVSAAVADPRTRTNYSFRFATMEHCQRMLPALAAGAATVTQSCRR